MTSQTLPGADLIGASISVRVPGNRCLASGQGHASSRLNCPRGQFKANPVPCLSTNGDNPIT